MKSSSLYFICTFAIATIVFQSVGVQSAEAQERMFGNGRFLKRVFGDLSPQSAKAKQPTPVPASGRKYASPIAPQGSGKKGQLQSKQPTAAYRPTQKTQPTLANQATRPSNANPRSIQPNRSDANHAPVNRLPKSSAIVDADSIPTRSNAKATLGFGMFVELQNDKLYVSKIDPNGNAATAGVEVGDRLIAGGGIDFESLSDYNGIADILEDGDQLDFELKRDGREKKMMIVFGEAPEEQAATIEGSVQDESASNRSMQAPRVDQINTRANNSFLPTQQNVEVQQRNQSFSSNGRQTSGRPSALQTIRSQATQIGSQLRNAVPAPAPSLQLPPSAESVMN